MATIVVMDDDDVVRGVLVRVLKMHGYTVLAFPDARPALDTVDFGEVDLVITDLSMPMPGDVAVEELRGRGIKVPVIVVSGHIPDHTAQHLVFVGVQKILNKPFNLLELLDIVQSLV